jgi:hypothetical protein
LIGIAVVDDNHLMESLVSVTRTVDVLLPVERLDVNRVLRDLPVGRMGYLQAERMKIIRWRLFQVLAIGFVMVAVACLVHAVRTARTAANRMSDL